MQFANSQLWGRASKLCLNAVTAHAYSGVGPDVQFDLAHYLNVFRQCLLQSKPREVTSSWGDPLFLFTDASFSPDSETWPCGLGGVLVDHNGTQVAAFSCKLDFDLLKVLGYPSKSTVIFEAELLPSLLVCPSGKRSCVADRVSATWTTMRPEMLPLLGELALSRA